MKLEDLFSKETKSRLTVTANELSPEAINEFPDFHSSEHEIENIEQMVKSSEKIGSQQLSETDKVRIATELADFYGIEYELVNQEESKSLTESDIPKEGSESQTGHQIPDYLLNDPEIVGYPDEEFQTEVYNLVSKYLPFNKYSIKDLGSGRCDFYNHIFSQDYSNEIEYIGVESNPNLCEVARLKYPNVNIINSDFLDIDIETDYSVCIGTLNDDHTQDKWEYFNKTLIYCQKTTKKSIIFVLSRKMDGLEGFLDYPFDELFQNFPESSRFTLEYSTLEDIYVLIVHIGDFN